MTNGGSPRGSVGDLVTAVRQAFDYRDHDRVRGPTVFQRGDTTYINQRGEVLARQRSTVMRYIVANLAKAGRSSGDNEPPV